jgi:hypothetical protein
MANLSDLIQQIAYLEGGGKPEGQRTLDKVNQTFSSLNNISGTINNIVADSIARKKAALDARKTEAEIPKIQQESEQLRLANEGTVRGNIPYMFIAPGGQSPEQTQALTNQVMQQPIPAQDLISGRLDTTQKGLYEIQGKIKSGQDKYGDLTQKEYLGDAAAQLKVAQAENIGKTEKASGLSPFAQKLYLQVPGRSLNDTLSKPELQAHEAYSRALISGGAGQKEENLILNKMMEDLPKMETAAKSASSSYSSINKALGLIKNGVTGKVGQAKAILAQYQDFFPGENFDNLDDAQTFQLLTRAITGPMRLDLIGPGQVSEFEQKLIQQLSGGGGASKKAADTLLNYYKGLAKSRVDSYNQRLYGTYKLNPIIKDLFKPIELKEAEAPVIPGSEKQSVGGTRRKATLEDFQ